jgi:2-amino-4-hydroxy-6-hydroxymethyldihydropteridine diphosphokinase
MVRAYLLLGGNLGNRFQLQEIAKDLIQSRIGTICNSSSYYETEPWGFTHEQNFLNSVVEVNTKLNPEELLDQIHEIESRLGRVRKKEQYSERTIDIDILFYDAYIIETERLTVPHIQFPKRKFALEPMNEIASEFIHPVFCKSIQELNNNCPDTSKVVKVNLQETI